MTLLAARTLRGRKQRFFYERINEGILAGDVPDL